MKENQEAFEVALPLNMGQLLSIPFILIGLFLLFSDREGRAIFARQRLKILFLVALLVLAVAALVTTTTAPVLTAGHQPRSGEVAEVDQISDH
ncbi:MAG: hypothetical protein HYX77_04120 [Acidobacteria bacterium]|nr:hypothetical protein [Acidobacteriota bacterium]